MKTLSVLFLLLCCSPVLAQKQFDIKNASPKFDVRLEVAGCDNDICEGAATFTLFNKGTTRPFQVFKLDDTSFLLRPDQQPPVNKTLLYDEQSAINFGDFDFDGNSDLALCDGTNGGYGMPSYQIYLFSPKLNRFVHSPAFTRLVQGESLGMFEVDAKRKVIKTFSKSGCCYHTRQEFNVVNHRPLKVLEITEDATNNNEDATPDNFIKVKITTKKLVQGRWQVKVRYERRKNE